MSVSTPARVRVPGLVAGSLVLGAIVTTQPATARDVPAFARPVAAASSAAVPLTTSCKNILVIGARGSGEAPQGSQSYSKAADHGRGPTVATATAALARGLGGLLSARTVPVVYPALSTSYLKPGKSFPKRARQYLAGVAVGKKFVLALLAQAESACPSEKFVLVGYSQGAMVMHQVLAAIAGRPDLLGRVAAAVLIADPDRAAKQGARNSGTAGDGVSGIDTWLRHSAGLHPIPIPSAVRGRTISVCNTRDLVCDFTARHAAQFSVTSKVHTDSYKGSGTLALVGTIAAAYTVRMFPGKACTGVIAGYPHDVCVAAASGDASALLALLDSSVSSDVAYVAQMQRSWGSPQAKLQLVRAMRAGYDGADWSNFPGFAANPWGVQDSYQWDELRTGAKWLGFTIPTGFRMGYVASYRGLVAAFIYKIDLDPSNSYVFLGVFHYGHRDSGGLLCRWPELPSCV